MHPLPKPLRLASRFLWLAACSLALPSSLLAQNAITPTAVNTSSMWDNSGIGGHKSKMIDGSGLSVGGSVLTQTHDNNSNVNSWHAGTFSGGISGGTTGNPPPVNGQVVEFDLGGNYNLSAAHIWNFNGNGFTGRGIKDVTILVSSSTSGPFNTLFTTQFAQASGLSNQLAQVVPISVNNVRRVRFAIQSAWSGEANEYVGLSEVRFSGAVRSVLIDDFSAGFNTVTGGTAPALLSTIASETHGTTRFGETVSSSIMGNNRQAGVRDEQSANPTAMTIQDGKVQFHGTANAPSRFLRYGSSVGTANPLTFPATAPFGSGTVTPLNLSLLPEHQILIDVSQMPNPTSAVGFLITLVSGSGASAIATVPASSTGVARLLLSHFPGMTAQFAEDIDGITIQVNGTASQGSTAATGLHVDSIRFALEDLVIDDFSAGFNVVTGGTAPTLLSSINGFTRFGETVSGSIIGNNRQAGVRDGQSSESSMTIQDGKLQLHGNGVAQSRWMRYGSSVGTSNLTPPPTDAPFTSGTVTPLNLALRLEHQIIIDITQLPDQENGASFIIRLDSGTGGSLIVSAFAPTVGRLRIPLSTFSGITPQFAADIDGITIRTDAQTMQGNTAANGMHIDSIKIATESLMIDDFSAGFNTVTGGTAPALLSTVSGTHGTTRFGETVSPSVMGNNRQAGVRDGQSAGQTAMTIQDGKLQVHGNATAPYRWVRYGSSVGTTNPIGFPDAAPFGSGTVTPLNLSLKLEDLLLIDIVQKPDQVTATGFTVTLTSGAGASVYSAVSTTTTGILSIPLSGFAGITPQIAADIDGITLQLGDQASQGSTAATGMHIDSIAVAFSKSNNADLTAFTTTAVNLTPTFAAATTSYNATVPNGTATITVTPTVAQADATVKVNGVNVTSGSASSAISLNVGTNTITTAVTAQSGFVKTYTLTVTRSAPPSNNADLSAFTTTAGTLTPPTFAAATTSYNATVPNATTSITVTPTVAQANATVKVNTVTVASGTASGNINLTVGTNTITTVVTAQDGTTTKTYTLTVTRVAVGAITWGAAQGWTGAASQVLANGVRHAAVGFMPFDATVNGVVFDRPTVGSGTSPVTFANSSPVQITSGFFQSQVTAPAGGDSSYTILVSYGNFHFNAASTITIGSLVVGQDYQVQVFMPYWDNSYPTTFASSGGVTSPVLDVGRIGGSPTPAGYLTGTFTATATSHVIDYRSAPTGGWAGVSAVSVRRTSISANADLASLTTTAGTLTPSTFAAATTSYAASVPNATTSVTVTPTVADASATVTVNGISVASGSASGNISLTVGANAIPVVVTAQSGATKIYTITVTRALTGVPIQPTAVNTTSMWDNSGIGGHKSKMVDGSGLSVGGSVLTQTHDNNSNVNSWHAGNYSGGISGGALGTPPAVNGQAVEFDLGANYDLTGAHIWNFNGAGFTGRGVKDVQILISSSTSGAFTALTTEQFTEATGSAALPAQVVPFTGASNVRRVRFSILSAWSPAPNEYVGLSEVRFQGTAVPLSSNADLAALTTTANGMTPNFAAATTSYNATVPNATTGITVTPTVAQPNATVQVEFVAVASGTASGNIPLTVGTNTITIIVTAQDGTTTKNYTLAVTRAAPAIPPSGNVLTPTVITTSQWSLNFDGWKDNMVNGLGLIGSGSDETKLHDALSNAFTMWHAGPLAGGISGGITGTPPSVVSQAIEFDLGANHNLTGAHVWNLNQAGALGRGVRGVEIFISPDASGTTTWTSVGTQEFTQGTGEPLAAQAVSFTGPNARRVRFAIQSAWSGAANEYVGLSEVRFRGGFAPVTVDGTNLGAIPDNNPTGREILFNVAGAAGVVKTVSTQFTFNPAHVWMSDLRIQLIAPNGTSAWIYQPSEGWSSDLLGPYTIADTGTDSLQTAATGLAANAALASGTYRAANGATLVSLNLSFGGTSPNGTWKLRFADLVAPDTTSVSQASLTLTTANPGKTTIQRETNGHMTLNLIEADSSANYDLMRSTDLQNWTLLESKTTTGSGATTHTDTAPPAPKGFYLYIPRP